MGLFDIFGTGDQQQAAQDQINALRAGQTAATGDVNTGLQNLQTSYAAGLAPLTQNYATTSAGTNQLANLLGFGPQGGAGMQQTMENLPGYQFALGQGTQNVQRTNAAQGFGGGGSSGNVDKAIADYTAGLASQNYNNYASQLQPFLTAGVNTGGQIGTLEGALGNQQLGAGTTKANIDYGTNVGIGNAQASSDLAGLNASANIWGALMGGGKLASGLFGMLG
jgi:hypothetical protein